MTREQLDKDLQEHGNFLSQVPDSVLAFFVEHPEVLTSVASSELAARGKNTDNQWVGFDVAKKLHEQRTND